MKFYMYILIVLLCFCSLISVYSKTIFHLFLTVGKQTMQMNLWVFFYLKCMMINFKDLEDLKTKGVA